MGTSGMVEETLENSQKGFVCVVGMKKSKNKGRWEQEQPGICVVAKGVRISYLQP